MKRFEMTTTDAPAHRPSRARNMFRRVLARAAGDTSGVAAIEFAIIVPILVLMVVATADIGMGFYRKMQVEGATQAGAEWAIKNGFDANAMSNAVISATSAPALSVSPAPVQFVSATSAPALSVSPAPVQFCGCANGSAISTVACGTTCPGGASAGTYTTVSAQMTYNTILNYGFFPSTYNFSSQSTVRLK
jgi:Flp pilus assembly protein TadG